MLNTMRHSNRILQSNRIPIALAAAVLAAGSGAAAAQQANETRVSSVGFGDIEFDWGRDGIQCPTCNFNMGNARFNWTDQSGKLYVGHLDPGTGNFTPAEGNNELVDTLAYNWKTWGNGPEWAFSTQNGNIVSQLVYTRHQAGANKTGFSTAAYASMVNGKWVARALPGNTGDGTTGSGSTIVPLASQCNSSSVPIAVFHNIATPSQSFWELVSSAAGTAPTMTPFGAYDNGLGERWLPCTHQMTFQGSAPPDSSGHVYQQVFWYDADTNVVQQLTTNAHGKHTSFMFYAPDFSHNLIFFTVSDHLEVDVFQQTSVYANGAPKVTLVNQIRSPDSSEPYINSAEPFINCTPQCATYVFMTLAPTSDAQNGHTVPNGLAVAALSPSTPLFKILVPASAQPAAQRLDPEYYITANGPYIYYQLGTVQTATKPFHNLGEYYIDTQLGAPSGACVGSSAQGGLASGC
jgi:hypothetical protein